MGLDILDWDELQKRRAAGTEPPRTFSLNPFRALTPEEEQGRLDRGGRPNAAGSVGAYIDARWGGAPSATAQPGPWVVAPPSVTDPAPPPNGTPSSEIDKLATFLRAIGGGQPSGAIRVASSVPVGGGNIVANREKQMTTLAGELDKKAAANQALQLAAENTKVAPVVTDRQAIWDKLNKDVPMPTDETYWARVAAHLPFMVNGRMDFSGARDHSLKFNEADFAQKKDALNRRDAELARRMGFSEAEIAQLDKIRQFENERKQRVAELSAAPLAGTKAQLDFTPHAMASEVSLANTAAHIAAQDRATAMHDPAARMRFGLGAIAAAEKAGIDKSSPYYAAIIHAAGGGNPPKDAPGIKMEEATKLMEDATNHVGKQADAIRPDLDALKYRILSAPNQATANAELALFIQMHPKKK